MMNETEIARTMTKIEKKQEDFIIEIRGLRFCELLEFMTGDETQILDTNQTASAYKCLYPYVCRKRESVSLCCNWKMQMREFSFRTCV